MKTYIKAFYGTNDAVESGVRKFDKIFRRMYNVYGGRREYSGRDAEGNYEVIMSYTANWIDMLPGFSISSINRTFEQEACRLPNNNNLWCDIIKEDDGTYTDKR